MQQDSGRAQICGRKKREQAAVLMCQEDGACNRATFIQVQQNQWFALYFLAGECLCPRKRVTSKYQLTRWSISPFSTIAWRQSCFFSPLKAQAPNPEKSQTLFRGSFPDVDKLTKWTCDIRKMFSSELCLPIWGTGAIILFLFCYLTPRVVASMSKKGLSHGDGVVHFFLEAVDKDNQAQMSVMGMNDA